MEKYFKEVLINMCSYLKGCSLLLFSFEKSRLHHSLIDIDPGSLLRRFGLVEAFPGGLKKRGQLCSTFPNPIVSLLSLLGPVCSQNWLHTAKRGFLFFVLQQSETPKAHLW